MGCHRLARSGIKSFFELVDLWITWGVQGVDAGPSAAFVFDSPGGHAFAVGALAPAQDLGGESECSHEAAGALDDGFG